MDSNKREGSAPLPTAKSKSTRKRYSSVGCRTGNWILPPSIPTLPNWMEDPSGDTLTSSAEDSPVRISALPGNSQESTDPAPVFGENTPDSFARFDPDTSSWRTSQVSLFTPECQEYVETWPQAGTMRSGVVFQRQRWVRPTKETESGSSGNWPTPRATGSSSTMSIERRQKGMAPEHLSEAVRMWPTPTAFCDSMYEDRSTNHHNRRSPGLASIVIREEKNWPTPNARDWKGAPGKGCQERGGHQSSLPAEVSKNQSWPTPTSRDHKDTGDSVANGTVPVNGLLGRAVAPTKMSGSLDPAFVEYLMGYPIGWTVLKPLETP